MVETKSPAQPATASSTVATPEPRSTWAKRLEALHAEREQLKAEKAGDVDTSRLADLLSNGRVSPATRARSEAIAARLSELDELDRVLQPHVRKEERMRLIAEQLAAFELRKQNQRKAAEVQAHLDDLAAQVAEAEKLLHRWKTTEPDGVFGSSQRLTRHRNLHPEIEEV